VVQSNSKKKKKEERKKKDKKLENLQNKSMRKNSGRRNHKYK
jgi:hypothetical protein